MSEIVVSWGTWILTEKPRITEVSYYRGLTVCPCWLSKHSIHVQDVAMRELQAEVIGNAVQQQNYYFSNIL